MLFVDTRLNITFIIFLSQCDEFWFFSQKTVSSLQMNAKRFSLQINFLSSGSSITKKNTDSSINKTDRKKGYVAPSRDAEKLNRESFCILRDGISWIHGKVE